VQQGYITRTNPQHRYVLSLPRGSDHNALEYLRQPLAPRTKGGHTENLITRFDEANGDDGFVELKMRVTLRRKGLRRPGGCSMEFAMLKIGLPIISFQRGLATRFGFKEGSQHDIRSGKFEEWHYTESAFIRLGGRERSPTLPGAEDGALISGRP